MAMRILNSLADKALSLITTTVEIDKGGYEMATKGKLVKFDTRRGEVRFRTDKPEQVAAPAPEPVAAPVLRPPDNYYRPGIGRGMPRITPRTPRLRR